MAAEVIGAVQDDDNMVLYTLLIGLVMIMIFFYKMAERFTEVIKCVFGGYDTKPEKVCMNVGIQTDLLDLERALHEAEQQLLDLERALHEAEQQRAKLRHNYLIAERRIQNYADDHLRLHAEIAELQSRGRDHDIWVTKHGCVWHATPECRHLQDHVRVKYRACRTCFPHVA